MNIVRLVLFILIVSVTPAYAYTDPGSGLLALQIVGSAFVGFMFYLSKIKKALKRMLRKEENAE
jgi:hypothetical protein